MNGCPNSCAQYQLADIGFQGAIVKAGGGKVEGFVVHIGGRLGEDARFGWRVSKPIPAEDARFAVERVVRAYAEGRRAPQTFADWAAEQPGAALTALVGATVAAEAA